MRFQYPIRSLLIAATFMAVFFALNCYIDLHVLKSRKSGTLVLAYQGWPFTFGEHASNLGFRSDSLEPAEFDGELSMERRSAPIVFNTVYSALLAALLTFLIQWSWPRSSPRQRIAFSIFVGIWIVIASGAIPWMDWMNVAAAFLDHLVPDFVREVSSSPMFSWPFNDYVFWEENPIRKYSVHVFWSSLFGLLSVWAVTKLSQWIWRLTADNQPIHSERRNRR